MNTSSVKAKPLRAKFRLAVMFAFDIVLFLEVERLGYWRSVEREIRLTYLAAMVAIVPLVLAVPVLARGRNAQRFAALVLAAYPAVVFLGAVLDMVKYLTK